jgi:hypothetical protein
MRSLYTSDEFLNIHLLPEAQTIPTTELIGQDLSAQFDLFLDDSSRCWSLHRL